MRISRLISFLLVFIAAAHAASVPLHHNDSGVVSNDGKNGEYNKSGEYDHGDKDVWFQDDDGNLVKVDVDEIESKKNDIDNDDENLRDVVLFYLYTQKNPSVYQQLYVKDEEALSSSNFDATKPTRIIVHGWLNSYRNDVCTKIRDAYLKNDDCVIIVDWSKFSIAPYTSASSRVETVGVWLAHMIEFLEKRGMNLAETILVGHSMGAHVVGIAGSRVSGTIGYIVGLDPARPHFESLDSNLRISKDDASYVQIIHTNTGFWGLKQAIGDSDFYPNGGIEQSGCIIDLGGVCSHLLSYIYFAESINSHIGFYGRSCPSYLKYESGMCNDNELAIMGGRKLDVKARGRYYLQTNLLSPYAKGA